MKILLVKPRHIGDSLLMTPTIRAIRKAYPDSQIWVVVRGSCEGILSGCPDIDKIITTVRPESSDRSLSHKFHDLRMIWKIRRERFDYAFDLGESPRGKWFTFFSGAKFKATSYFHYPDFRPWKWVFNHAENFTGYGGHSVIRDFRTVASVLNIGTEPPPLVFEKTVPSHLMQSGKRFVFIHPGTRWKRKQWPLEKWVSLCDHLKSSVDTIVISTGRDSEEVALALSLKERCGEKLVLTEGKLSWGESADLLYRAVGFIGVDTAMSHLAAACQCPSAVLFGASYEGAWRPWKSPHRIVLPPGCPELDETLPIEVAHSYRKRNTEDIRVEDVISAFEEITSTARKGQ